MYDTFNDILWATASTVSDGCALTKNQLLENSAVASVAEGYITESLRCLADEIVYVAELLYDSLHVEYDLFTALVNFLFMRNTLLSKLLAYLVLVY